MKAAYERGRPNRSRAATKTQVRAVAADARPAAYMGAPHRSRDPRRNRWNGRPEPSASRWLNAIGSREP